MILDQDPDSLDTLTFWILWESPWETPLWEVFWQRQDTGDTAGRVEEVLRDLYSEKAYTFVRRPMNDSKAETTELNQDEVAEAIADPKYRDPTTLIGDGVWMLPTDRYFAWRDRVEQQLPS